MASAAWIGAGLAAPDRCPARTALAGAGVAGGAGSAAGGALQVVVSLAGAPGGGGDRRGRAVVGRRRRRRVVRVGGVERRDLGAVRLRRLIPSNAKTWSPHSPGLGSEAAVMVHGDCGRSRATPGSWARCRRRARRSA